MEDTGLSSQLETENLKILSKLKTIYALNKRYNMQTSMVTRKLICFVMIPMEITTPIFLTETEHSKILVNSYQDGAMDRHNLPILMVMEKLIFFVT